MSATEDYPRICPAGDQSLLVEFGASYSRRVSRAVIAFDSLLQSAPDGVWESVPTIRSVLIDFDPTVIALVNLIEWVEQKLRSRDWYNSLPPESGRRWRIPVIYGGDFGPDLMEAAEIAGLAGDELIALHSSIDLDVLCLGFSPGLAYLAELPEQFAIPRRQAYGRPVPAGSILVANRQTVLPATPIPTGWRRIGVTPLPTFLPDRVEPFLLSPGDRVKFEPISEVSAANVSLEAYWD